MRSFWGIDHGLISKAYLGNGKWGRYIATATKDPVKHRTISAAGRQQVRAQGGAKKGVWDRERARTQSFNDAYKAQEDFGDFLRFAGAKQVKAPPGMDKNRKGAPVQWYTKPGMTFTDGAYGMTTRSGGKRSPQRIVMDEGVFNNRAPGKQVPSKRAFASNVVRHEFAHAQGKASGWRVTQMNKLDGPGKQLRAQKQGERRKYPPKMAREEARAAFAAGDRSWSEGVAAGPYVGAVKRGDFGRDFSGPFMGGLKKLERSDGSLSHTQHLTGAADRNPRKWSFVHRANRKADLNSRIRARRNS